jgi:hypothetical protein
LERRGENLNNDISTTQISTFTMAPAATGGKKQKKKWYVVLFRDRLISLS